MSVGDSVTFDVVDSDQKPGSKMAKNVRDAWVMTSRAILCLLRPRKADIEQEVMAHISHRVAASDLAVISELDATSRNYPVRCHG